MERKIDVMIVGAQKAGTTSLLRYLGEHPSCIAHPQKEFAYFVDNDEYVLGYDYAFQKYYCTYKTKGSHKLVAKSAALYCDETAIKRLKEHNPDCKIILLLRNPVERTYSSYLMEKNYGSLKFDFKDLPGIIKNHQENDNNDWEFNFFIEFGLYAKYLQVLQKYFPENQIKVILYEDFKNDSLKICRDIFSDLGIDTDFIPKTEIKHNKTQKTVSSKVARFTKHVLRKNSPIRKLLMFFIPENKSYRYGEMLRNVNKTKETYSEMDYETKKYLIDFYKNLNIQLEKLINKDLSHWNK